MKKTIPVLLSLALIGAGFAHEAVTIGPNGGRVLYVDSTATPNVEVLVNTQGQAEIWLLDKDRKPIGIGKQSISVTAGTRAEAKKLEVEAKGDKFVTSPVPGGAPYTMIVQLKEAPDAKAKTLRLNYDPTLAESGKPKYIDDSVNTQSGENIEVPATAAGIWAEVNQHQKELENGFAEKEYEALDEVTRAYPKLVKGLPAKSDQASAVQPLVDQLVADLTKIREANASRQLEEARAAIDGVSATLAELKKLYPESVANTKL